MTRKTWSTTDVSAYLDGALPSRTQTQLEADMAQDPALQRRVQEMRQVVSLVQGMALREPPRNYLLTPSMVAEPKQTAPTRRSRPRFSLFALRLATSAVALAFVVTSGLVIFQQGISPRMALESATDQQVQVAQEREMAAEEAVPTVVVEMPAAEEAPMAPEEEGAIMAMKVVTETEAVVLESEVAPTPSAMTTPLPREDALRATEPETGDAATETPVEGAAAPVPEETATAADEESAELPIGIGGGGTPPPDEAPVAETPLVEAAEPAEEEAPMALAVEATEEAVPEALPTEEVLGQAPALANVPEETGPAEISEPLGAAETAAPTWNDEAVRTGARPPSVWVPIGLGIATFVLAAVTLWLSRRPTG